jgi:hypothetical protein
MKKSYLMLLLVAMFALVACYTNWNYPSKDACTTYVNNLIEQSQDFDGESIAKWLPGVWTEDSIFFYDEGWGAIEDIRKYKGDWNDDIAGGTNGEYTFGADGKGAYSYTPGYPPFDERVLSFAWQYEEADKTLVLTGKKNKQFKVSGFNGKYIILDFYDTVNKHNERQILKKKVE